MTLALWRRYAFVFRGLGLRVAGGATLAVVAGLALVPVPLLVGAAFDRVIPARRVSAIVEIGALLLALQIVSSACTLWMRVVVIRATKEAISRLRREAIAKLFSVSRSFYAAHPPSALHDLVVPETERIESMSNALLAEMAPAVVLSLGVSSVLVVLNWWLFLAMAAVLPANLIAGRFLGRAVRARIRRFHASFARLSQGVLFVARAMDLTRIQAAEQVEASRQAERIDDLRRTSGTMAVATTAYTVVQQTLIAVAGVAVLVAGGGAVARGVMTTGTLLSFFAGLMLLRMPLNTIMVGLPRVIEGVQSLAAVVAFLDDPDRRPYSGTTRVAFSGRIAMHGVTFSYGEQPVLSGLFLTLEPGETVALVGPNGSGKSTLVNLILGFYRPQRGVLSADDVPFDRADLRALTMEIGVVTQNPIMVPGTIRDNLLYGAPDEPWDAVLENCRRAGVDAFVSELPLGYDTPVGEEAESLSGGQRQRVSIARALLGRPKLLILDEPMNHLDESSGPEFFERLTAGARRPAILLISHRPDIISMADRVVHLQDGRLVEAAVSAAV